MSYSVDVNVLLHASNVDSPRHERARVFLEQRVDAPDLFCLAWTTLMGYIRIATHPSVFRTPLSPRDAVENVQALCALPRVRTLSEGDDFLSAYQDVTRGSAVRGNLVPDAYLATLLRQHGVRTLYTADADFHRFPFLEVRDPFAS
jgi:toxin-antitoxin system PIN domain toxin